MIPSNTENIKIGQANVVNFPLIVKQKSCFLCHPSCKAQTSHIYKTPIRTLVLCLKKEKQQQQKWQLYQELYKLHYQTHWQPNPITYAPENIK